jgi:threonine-phosphate decarboxylase
MNLKHGGNIFEIAQQHGWRWEDIADFSASINPLGPAPAVLRAIQGALARIVHYPESEPSGLRRALAERWALPEECLLLGNGATELIYFFSRIIGPKKVTLAAPVFSEFHRAFPGAAVVAAHSPDEWPREGLLVVSRPANPGGQMPDLAAYLKSTSNPLLIDESFLEFTGAASLAPLVQERPNLFVLRSLTKFYALPGLRIGAIAAAEQTIAGWRTHREPWQVNVLAEAGARAAIADEQHCRRTIEFVRGEREWLFLALAGLSGVRPQPSMANYLLVDTDYDVEPLAGHLLQARILVRNCSGWPGVPFRHALRVAVRTRCENQRLIEAWKAFPCD